VIFNQAITDWSGLVVDTFADVSASSTVSIATSDQRYFRIRLCPDPRNVARRPCSGAAWTDPQVHDQRRVMQRGLGSWCGGRPAAGM